MLRSSRWRSATSVPHGGYQSRRSKLNRLPVASAFLQAVQDLRIGGRSSNAMYQYTIQSDTTQDLTKWGPILTSAMQHLPGLQDVSSDQQNGGLDEMMTYDRVTAARLGDSPPSRWATRRYTAPSANRKYRSSTRS